MLIQAQGPDPVAGRRLQTRRAGPQVSRPGAQGLRTYSSLSSLVQIFQLISLRGENKAKDLSVLLLNESSLFFHPAPLDQDLTLIGLEDRAK